MADGILNHDLLPGNICFGCGLENPQGLHIEIRRDPFHADRLVGVFAPSAHMTGFPGLTHGGAIYTAFDCLATWVALVLRKDAQVVWILRSAQITYHRPALEGQPLSLVGRVVQEGDRGSPLIVRTEAYKPMEELVAEADFKVVPLSVARFKQLAGVEKLPEGWGKLLGEHDQTA